MQCNKCGYKWLSRKENPLCCPRCKSYDYNKEYDVVDNISEVEIKKEVKENDKWNLEV